MGTYSMRTVRPRSSGYVMVLWQWPWGAALCLISEECGKSVEKHWWVQPKVEPVPGGAQCFYRRGRGRAFSAGAVFRLNLLLVA